MSASRRLLIVANRLPVTIRPDGDQFQVEASIGGVATGLARLHRERQGLWFGWSGIVPDDEAAASRLRERLAEIGCVPLPLSAVDVVEFYERTCNAVIWPLFHYLSERLPLEMGAFDAYQRVNQRMADLVAEAYRPGDVIWIHDYHFLLLPGLLRERLPNARIGLFLHIPFPSSELFRLLPEREALLEGMLGADLIGFHTASYLRHFTNTLLVVSGIPAVADRIRMPGREVRVGAFPMGVDVDYFEGLAAAPETAEAVIGTRESTAGRILLAIDRLDYTKGVLRRLLAFEQLLIRHPELIGQVRLLNLAAPSRETVEAYREHREDVDAVVGRINGRFGTATWVPVHYMYRSASQPEVVALYRTADVMLVTPLRDGMNLVAKEYVASRTDDDGVLVLSEFAGAAAELGEAVLVNPYDAVGTADAIYEALTMPIEERRRRIQAMRARVRGGDVHRWTSGFLDALDQRQVEHPLASAAPGALADATARALESERLVLLLDYDGTLVPHDPAPERALPDEPLLDLLTRLAARKRTQVHIVSGRSSGFLDRWLGSLPIHLHGEFGGWYRDPEERVWQRTVTAPTGWQELVRPILTEFSRVTPGAAVEFKRECLAWHWRRADPRFGQRQARELALHLTQLLANEPVEVLFGAQVLEVRPQGMHKGKALSRVTNGRPSKTLMVAIGDEPADDDLFRAMPDDAVRIRVGPGPTLAPIRVGSVAEVRTFLFGLLPRG